MGADKNDIFYIYVIGIRLYIQSKTNKYLESNTIKLTSNDKLILHDFKIRRLSFDNYLKEEKTINTSLALHVDFRLLLKLPATTSVPYAIGKMMDKTTRTPMKT
jgi:hypothetical protein